MPNVSVRPGNEDEDKNVLTDSRRTRTVAGGLMLLGMLMIMVLPGFARDKYETIEGQVFGTGTQLGQNVGVKLIIYEYSTPEDRQILVDAFMKGQSQGLSNALRKMPAVGRMSITGTVGTDVAFIRLIKTPTGRKIRFVANRQIRMGEAWTDSNSMAFDLTAGEIDLNDQDKKKSAGVLFPATQLTVDKSGQLTWELNRNPWRLAAIIDWNAPKNAK
jgi:hypothetical protein